MNVALITTVFNEEDSIEKFLDSIVNQTQKPFELVIVDAGSKDKTVAIIKNYSKKLPLKLFIHKGNRSVGRNFAIKNATSNIIAVTDVGCILEKHWLERITAPFKKGYDVAAGFYKPTTNNVFEKSLATYTCVPLEKVTENFLPSSRSVAFKKNSWETVGGYPENLDTCEDLVFAKKLKMVGLKFIVVKNAVVYWPQRESIMAAAMQFFNYALGDGMAGYYRAQTPLLFGRYIFLAFLVLILIVTRNSGIYYFLILIALMYFLWSILKNYKYIKHPLAFLYLPLLQVVSDFFVILGTSFGTIKRLMQV